MESLVMIYKIYDYLKGGDPASALDLIEKELMISNDPLMFPHDILKEILELEKQLYGPAPKGRGIYFKQNRVVETTQKINDLCIKVGSSNISEEQKKNFAERAMDVKIRIARDILGVDVSKLKNGGAVHGKAEDKKDS